MNLPQVDETLLKRRAVIRAFPCNDGLGWDVELNCGHTVWYAVRPTGFVHCGACLHELSEQARAFVAAQRKPEAKAK